MRLAILILAAVAAFAAEAPKEKPAAKQPDPAKAAAFWKERSKLLELKLALIEQDAATTKALSAVSCEAGYELVAAQSLSGLECVPKPEPPKEATKK